ncbi:hypothetical protein PRZ48_008957 [Zasmidium cellare]|uniref:F-box domain-containing protein n=1 Tax=Zasmidium cellare TaxID=395010 RepID=A0ABR0EGY9_ZASCE|nr:hypothetical protein PRZ48_008957 [Zasmidium cellare]
MLVDDLSDDWCILEKYEALGRTRHRKLRQDHAAMGGTLKGKISTAQPTFPSIAPSHTMNKGSVPNTTKRRAAQRAFNIIEIVTNILLFLDPVTVASIERVNKTSQSAIDESPRLRRSSRPATTEQRTRFLLSRPNANVYSGICTGTFKTFEQNYRQHRERTGQTNLLFPLEGCPRFVYGFRRNTHNESVHGEVIFRIDSRQEAFALSGVESRPWRNVPLAGATHQVEVVLEYMVWRNAKGPGRRSLSKVPQSRRKSFWLRRPTLGRVVCLLRRFMMQEPGTWKP